MKKILVLLLFAAVAADMPAQVNFGVKGGLNVSHMSLSKSVVSSNNRSGFYIGPTMKAMLPGAGVGFDLSVLYDQRQGGVFVGVGDEGLIFNNGKLDREEQIVHQRQITVPLNIRYELGLGDLVGLLLFAGPELGLNVGSKVRELEWGWKSTNLSVNVGLGVMLLEHLQISANYNIACGRAGDFTRPQSNNDPDKGRIEAWQVGLAYYF